MDELTVLDRHARKEIVEDIWRKFVLCSSRMTTSFFPYAIQITIFPPRREEFQLPDAKKAVHATKEDDHNIEETIV